MRYIRVVIFFVLCLTSQVLVSGQSDDCTTSGTLSRETYHSNPSNRDRYFSIYLPPCYETTSETYPVVYLLHGSNGDDSQWSRLGFNRVLEESILREDAPPFIVVLPFGENVANDNTFEGVSFDEIMLDLMNYIKTTYRVSGKQAIGGISRGGFWAYHIGLRYPDQFVAIGGHSPFFDPMHVAPEYNPLNLAGDLPEDTPLKLWLDRGTDDYASDGIERMNVVLITHRIPHTYQVYPDGIHDESSWATYIEDYVAFYASAFSDVSDTVQEPANTETNALELYIPAGAFPALNTSIDSSRLNALLNGELDDKLILSQTAFQTISARGFVLHPEIRVTTDDTLEFRLWQDKNLYTLMPFDQLTQRFRPLWVDDIPVVDQLDMYPLVWESETPNYDPDKLTRITLSGTTAIARNTLTAFDEVGVEYAVGGIRDYVTQSDYFHITNEASIAETCPQFTSDVLGGNSSMCMKPDHRDFFALLDVDIVDLTGNHINDFGYQPLENMLDMFTEQGIQVVGGGRNTTEAQSPLIIEHNGSRIGWIACNSVGPYYAMANDNPAFVGGVRPGGASCDEKWLSNALPILSSQVDVTIVTVQYLEIEDYLPTQQHRIDYRRFAEWGADIVVGTSEHKPMIFEYYLTRRGETVFIHYGLGNLFFDQPFWGNMRFFMDTLYIYDGRLLTVELFPGIIEGAARPQLMTAEDEFNFLHFLFIQQNGF